MHLRQKKELLNSSCFFNRNFHDIGEYGYNEYTASNARGLVAMGSDPTKARTALSSKHTLDNAKGLVHRGIDASAAGHQLYNALGQPGLAKPKRRRPPYIAQCDGPCCRGDQFSQKRKVPAQSPRHGHPESPLPVSESVRVVPPEIHHTHSSTREQQPNVRPPFTFEKAPSPKITRRFVTLVLSLMTEPVMLRCPLGVSRYSLKFDY